MALSSASEMQRIKERVLKLPEGDFESLLIWINACSDVKKEMSRTKKEEPNGAGQAATTAPTAGG